MDNAGVGDITADIDLKKSYNIHNSKKRTLNQLKADTESLVSYEEVKENFIGINEAEAMKTYLDMGDNYIYNVKTPIANDQASNKSYVDTTATNTINGAALIHATKAELADYLKKKWNSPNDWKSKYGRQTNIQSAISKWTKATNTIGFY